MPELYTFGDGTKGQLGHAGGKKEKVSFKSPVRVDTSGPMHGLSCGHFHSLALSQDGAVYSWGSGVMGLLGHGTEEDGSMPRLVEVLGPAAGSGAVAKVACGPFQSAAVTKRGELYVFGWAALPAPPQRPDDQESSSSTPPQMPSTFHTKPNLVKTLPQGLRVVGVACGCYAIAAWSTSGKLLTWGKGGGGQLGHGGVRDESAPRIVQGVELEHVVEAAFGGSAKPEVGVLLVRSSSGTLHSCGCAANGRLGRPEGEPFAWGTLPLPEDDIVVSVAAADHHACAVTEGGTLYVWGCNEGLQLGLEGAGKSDVIQLPTSTLQGVQVVAAACSSDATLALGADGRAYQLGGGAEVVRNAVPRTPALELEGKPRCVSVFGGGATLGLLLAKGTGGGGGGGGGAKGSGAAAAAAAVLQPPPLAAALIESYRCLSPQLAELIAAPCETQSVVQLQEELVLLDQRLRAEQRRAAVLRARAAQALAPEVSLEVASARAAARCDGPGAQMV